MTLKATEAGDTSKYNMEHFLKQLPPGTDVSKLDSRVRRLFEIPQPPQRSAEWLAMRIGVLTASDAAAALDIKPFASFSGSPRADLLKKKAQQSAGIQTFQGNKFTQHASLRTLLFMF